MGAVEARWDWYKQSVPALGLSIQRGTSAVPADGYYYVLLHGEIAGRYRGLRQATARYQALIEERRTSVPSVKPESVDYAKLAAETYMDQVEAYWSASHMHTRRGGKARH